MLCYQYIFYILQFDLNRPRPHQGHYQPHHTSTKREMWLQLPMVSEKSSMANNGDDYVQKKVVRRNHKGKY